MQLIKRFFKTLQDKKKQAIIELKLERKALLEKRILNRKMLKGYIEFKGKIERIIERRKYDDRNYKKDMTFCLVLRDLKNVNEMITFYKGMAI